MNNRIRLAKRMRWTARVIGLCVAGFFLTFLIGDAITSILIEGLPPVTREVMVEVIPMGVLGGIALAGGIVSWRRERLASILLIAAAIGVGILIEVPAQVRLMFGLPYLIAGVLLLTSWWLSRKTP